MEGDTFGQRLQQARKERGLTQTQLAEQMHVSRQTISSWENGRFLPDYDTVARLADTLSLDASTMTPTQTRQKDTPEDTPPVEALVDSAPERHRRVWTLALAATFLLLCVTVALLRPWHTPVTDEPYASALWFHEEQPNEAGKSHIFIYAHETPVKVDRTSPKATPMWRFPLIFREVNGIGFTVDELTTVFFGQHGVLRVDSSTEDVFKERIVGATHIGANEFRQLYLFERADQQAIVGMGCFLKGVDDANHELCFRAYVPFDNE